MIAEETFPAPFDVDLDRFLSGPRGRPLDVDRIFAKSFEIMLGDFLRDDPAEIEPDGADEGHPSLFDCGLIYREVPAGLMLFHGRRPVGGYLSCDVGLDPDYQGRGLGAEIILERCLRLGESPVWHLDEPSYSPAGLAAFTAAWRLARSRPDVLALRLARLGPTAGSTT